ncbi:hypothetical protein BDF20DRAFT_889733 [Mycotypha africana]|uniref:uncharacterized protein n=1 Tax=Mycotypha africana TaxID=64632 RepID=UPI00230049A2|nr:uncharacterized protein BDF20DRAFT_889733 [Mycotypha africana]KAI8970181.1 hypothetical protein BDF20DRAFT_889733 [Mycotypha africana]
MGFSQRTTNSRTSSQKSFTIEELFKRSQQQQRNALAQLRRLKKSQQQHQNEEEEEEKEEDDPDLLLALQISKEEHLTEQKKLLEHFSRLSQAQNSNNSNRGSSRSGNNRTKTNITPNKKVKKERVIIDRSEDEDETPVSLAQNVDTLEEDEWFETISPRPQLPRYLTQRKKLSDKSTETVIFDKKGKETTTAATAKRKEITTDNTNANSPYNIISNIDRSRAQAGGSTLSEMNSSKVVVKKEKDEEGVLLDVDDMSEWLKVKEEEDVGDGEGDNHHLVIDDFTAFLNEEDSQKDIVTNKELSQPHKETEDVYLPIDFNINEGNTEGSIILIDDDDDNIKYQATSDIDDASDCSVIDLVNPNNNTTNNSQSQQQVHEEDDGYLSPLEGFTNLDRSNAEFNPFFEQLQPRAPAKRTRKSTAASTSSTAVASSTTTKRKKASLSKWPTNKRKRYFAKMKRKKRT